jgi:hypothetical protein
VHGLKKALKHVHADVSRQDRSEWCWLFGLRLCGWSSIAAKDFVVYWVQYRGLVIGIQRIVGVRRWWLLSEYRSEDALANATTCIWSIP